MLAHGARKQNMFPCTLQLLFLVMELTGILISLSKGSGWEGFLFRLVRAFRCCFTGESRILERGSQGIQTSPVRLVWSMGM